MSLCRDPDQLYRMALHRQMPFGIPTHVWRSDRHGTTGVRAWIANILERHNARGNLHISKERMADELDHLSDDCDGTDPYSKAFAKHGSFPWIYRFPIGAGHDFYKDPVCNFVMAPGISYTFARALCLAGHAPDFSSYDSSVRLFTLWHEYAHGTGAGEPQADKMAAVVFIKSVGPNGFLPLWADTRALETIVSKDNQDLLDKYGWPMVEAVDSVIENYETAVKMPFPEIKTLRCERYDHKTAAVQAFADQMFASVSCNTLANLEEFSVDFARAAHPDDPRRRIASRFALAAWRLSQGPAAYGLHAHDPPPYLPYAPSY